MTNFENDILLIDDDKMHLSILAERLKSLSFKNVETAYGFKNGAEYFDNKLPDLVIIDHFLDESKTSIDFIKEFLIFREVPVIVISTFYNEKVFEELLPLYPLDFLSKSCSDFELSKSIHLAFNKIRNTAETSKLKDFFFVKVGKNIKKLNLEQIEMIAVDGKYLNIHTGGRGYIVRSALVDFIKRLPANFIKIHQSFIVNLDFVESILVDENIVKLKNCEASYSRNFKKKLLNSYLVS